MVLHVHQHPSTSKTLLYLAASAVFLTPLSATDQPMPSMCNIIYESKMCIDMVLEGIKTQHGENFSCLPPPQNQVTLGFLTSRVSQVLDSFFCYIVIPTINLHQPHKKFQCQCQWGWVAMQLHSCSPAKSIPGPTRDSNECPHTRNS